MDPDREILLETPRLQLEPLRAAHADALYPLLAEPRLYEFIPQDPPPDLAALIKRYRRLEHRASDDGAEAWLNWALRARDLDGGPLVGTVQATVRADAGGRVALLAYELGLRHQHRGYATEACGRVVAHLFNDWQVERVIAEVDTLNGPSIRLLERLGFAKAALIRDADRFKGRSSDEWRFELAAPPRGPG